ncbi:MULTISPECIES: RagB/SusD family nutrient uptake outer membrane protein [Sphingobacterium]|uniref:RagB/SusD family nutrient uptake outer membrane protein n=1 Tax=Sphingobacterium TaxID=28453 RepID=UPI0013DC3DE4|nr:MULTISPECIES: RagB/SusD family nutrient uptake outer membrane protein [unclassified Sphingobacterium]
MKNIFNKRIVNRFGLGAAFISLLTVQSCKIDVELPDLFTEDAILSEAKTTEMYLNGMYNEIKSFQFGVFPNLGYDNATDGLTDIMKYTSTTAGNGTVNVLAYNAQNFSPASVGLNYWEKGYERIRRLNELIHLVKTKSVLDDAKKLQFEAEARFLRGYVYFWLAKIHGSIVLLDDISQYTESKDHPRSSEEAVYRFISNDFEFAAKNLDKTNLSGRATKGAAYLMMARTNLYAASIAKFDKKQFNPDELTGIPEAKASEFYEIAATAANEILKLGDEGIYALEDDFKAIFNKKNYKELTKEAVFRIDFAAPQVTHQYDLGFAPPGDLPGQTLVYGVPTAELVNEFEMADGSKFSWANTVHAANPYTNREPRFYATILYNGSVWKGRTLTTVSTNSVEGFTPYGAAGDPKRTVTGYYSKKFLDETNRDFLVNKSTQSWIELRYAEAFLIYAEAKGMLNQVGDGLVKLNVLRNKRGLPSRNAASSQVLLDLVEHERVVELAFEGHRFWDLRRWRKAHLALNNVKFTGHKPEAITGGGYRYTVESADNALRTFTGSLYYLPIPEAEVQRNDELTQIKGW